MRRRRPSTSAHSSGPWAPSGAARPAARERHAEDVVRGPPRRPGGDPRLRAVAAQRLGHRPHRRRVGVGERGRVGALELELDAVGISARTRSSSSSPPRRTACRCRRAPCPATTVRLTSSGVPASIHVTLAAGTASLSATHRPREVDRRRGHLGRRARSARRGRRRPRSSMLVAGPCTPANTDAGLAPGRSKSSAQSAAQLVAVGVAERREPRAAELLLALASRTPGGTGSAPTRTRASTRPARPWSWRRRARRCARRAPRRRTGRRVHCAPGGWTSYMP